MTVDALKEFVFSIKDEKMFRNLALEIFQYQLRHNNLYASFCDKLGMDKHNIQTVEQIPFLPVEFFRDHSILSSSKQAQLVFESSGTSSVQTSKHLVVESDMYIKSFLDAFKIFYGDPSDYCILALLPSYLERKGSSLVFMIDRLIKLSKHPLSGFYLNNLQELKISLQHLRSENQGTILFGVSFALLDMANKFPLHFPELTIIETGGMKGRRREMVREELHTHLKKGFGVEKIHSEYGMTELLSQAYSQGDGIFRSPPWMKILIRDINDPLTLLGQGRTGGINVIDLANMFSCSFIETKDLGKRYSDHSFEVLGRFDQSDIRGCNLMVV